MEAKSKEAMDEERSAIVEFFQSLLREDIDWSIADEYPLIFGDANFGIIKIDPQNSGFLAGQIDAAFSGSSPAQVFLIEERGKLLAGLATLIREVQISSDRRAKVCFVGSVITREEYRQQGYQRDLFTALDTACRKSEIDLILLWSNQLKFYEKLGFFLGGLQATWSSELKAALCSHSKSIQSASLALSQKTNFKINWYEAFNQKTMRVSRSAEEMRSLLKIPQMYIASTENAYALYGKGEDFKNVCHEWAGPTEEVLSCLERLRREFGNLSLLSPGVLHSDEERLVVRQLESSSYESRLEYLALMKILNSEFTEDDFSPEKLKYPFFIWGLDSI